MILEEPSPCLARSWLDLASDEPERLRKDFDEFLRRLSRLDSKVDMLEDSCEIAKAMLEHGYVHPIPRLLDILREDVEKSQFDYFKLLFLRIELIYAEKIRNEALVSQTAVDFSHISIRWQEQNIKAANYVVSMRQKLEDLEQRAHAIELENRVLAHRAETDSLTGIANRFRFNERAEEIFDAAAQQRIHFGLEMLDVDNFKGINDVYGHQVGDSCLQMLGSALRDMERDERIFAARYGGDEFILVYSGMTDEEILDKAEQLRQKVCQFKLQGDKDGSGVRVTISQGIRNAVPVHGNKLWDFTHAADQALYDVKRGEKGRILLVQKNSEVLASV